MGKLSFKNKFGYAIGDMANGLTFAMSAGFLLSFYVDVLGITGAAAATLFLVARMWDAINDPMMGSFTDKMFKKRLKKKTSKKVDKFRPYLLMGSWPVVIMAILMFFSPDGLGSGQKLIWAYVTYIGWGMAYTFINIPYGSIAAVMTQEPSERASLSVARGLGGMVGNILPRIIVPVFLTSFATDQQKGYLIAMAVMGLVAFVGYLVTYFTLEERVAVKESKNENVSLISAVKVLRKNRPFIAVSVASIAMLTGMLTNQAMSVFYFRENLDALSAMGITAVIQMVPMLFLAPVLSKVVKRFGTKKVVSLSSVVSAVFLGILMFLPDNLFTYVGFFFVGSLMMTVPNMLIWGMVSDTIDYNQYLCGERSEGIIYGSYSFVRKTGQAIAGFIAGMGITIVGYTQGLEMQSAQTLFGIKFLTIGFPAAGMLIAFLAFRYIWNLTPEMKLKVDEAISA
ncbi:MFS transporter [Acidaminobacter sp. JC074]|uniref:glycoside-pentoside-hexuronide (GPH):cation symporter n=1 Tax=Acidaminobacter sp. JC074 TaxID=2530199 RepID=UPI001F0D7893|nr:glycoside-pentoside-hexuronide (GPH):cation symporter [Acidaminobacter sp. JC074]MCH4886452.1 MFS transporter [Acidaminobacter sp. JC074]